MYMTCAWHAPPGPSINRIQSAIYLIISSYAMATCAGSKVICSRQMAGVSGWSWGSAWGDDALDEQEDDAGGKVSSA